VRNSL